MHVDGVNYPNDGAYQLRQRQVRAMKFDGSKANAHAILAYVFLRKGTGHIASRDGEFAEPQFGLHIDGISGYIPEGSWVVSMHEQNNFVCLNDDNFRLTYEPVPQGLQPRVGGRSDGGFGG